MLCDVARGAEELVCVLVLRGSCEKKERRRRDGIVEIILLVPQHHLTSRVPCAHTTAAAFKVHGNVWLSGGVLESTSCGFQLARGETLTFARLSSVTSLASAVASCLQLMSVMFNG